MLYRSVLGDSFESPFFPKRKCSLLGAAALGAAGSLASGVIGAISGHNTNESNIEFQREANEKNIALQRETNAQNERLYRMGLQNSWKELQYQNQFNLDMWNRANEYNEPAKVAARLRQAGINPALAYGQPANASQVNSGVPNHSVPPALSSPSVGAPHVDNYMPSAIQGAATAFNAYVSDRMMQKSLEEKDVDIREKNLKIAFDAESFANRLVEKLNSARKGSIEYEQAKRELDLLNATFGSTVAISQGQSAMLNQQIELTQKKILNMNLQNEQMKIINKYLPKLNDAQLASIYKSIQVANSQINLNSANAADAYASASLKAVQESGVKLDNKQKDQIREYVVNTAREELESVRISNRRGQKEYKHGTIIPSLLGHEFDEWDNAPGLRYIRPNHGGLR